MSVLKKYTDYLPTQLNTKREQVLKLCRTSSYTGQTRKQGLVNYNNNENRLQWQQSNTVYNGKRPTLQFPWAGHCSSGNFGCQVSFLKNNKRETNTVQKIYFVGSIILILWAYFFYFWFWSPSWRVDLWSQGINSGTHVPGSRSSSTPYHWHLSGVTVG
jgi:hypothetical protein